MPAQVRCIVEHIIDPGCGADVVESGLGADLFGQGMYGSAAVSHGPAGHIHDEAEDPAGRALDDKAAQVRTAVCPPQERRQLRERIKRATENQPAGPGRDAPRVFERDISAQ